MIIEELKKTPGLTINTKQASQSLGCNEKTLRSQLIKNPNFFGFPVLIFTTKSGYKKILIPKMPFVQYLSTGNMLEENERNIKNG